MKRAVVVLLLLIANAIFGAEPTKLPETAPGQLMQEWLEALNRADAAALAKFAEEHYTPPLFQGRSPSDIGEGQRELRQARGPLAVYRVQKSTENELSVVLKADNGFVSNFSRLSFTVDSAEPTRLQARTFSGIATPPEAAPKRMSAAAVTKELEPKLEELVRKDAFSGAVLIAKDGKVIWQKAYGLQDREAGIPANLETRFRLGSMNKMFTSVAIAQLVERGKLKFADPLTSVLPEYPNQEVAQKITVDQLLTHTSGLGDIFTPEFESKQDSLRDLKDYLSLFVDQPPRFEPGKGWSYSNAGYIVLGLIIEKASGQNYYDYVQEHIYNVAGMTSSGSVPKTEKFPILAVGYMHGPGGDLRPNTHTLPWRGMSAGGGDSTVGDLLRFANALREKKLLSAALTETITTGKVEPSPGNPDQKYAYGFIDNRRDGRRIVGHGGGAPGMNGQLSVIWDEGYTVVSLANLDPSAAEDVAAYILGRLES